MAETVFLAFTATAGLAWDLRTRALLPDAFRATDGFFALSRSLVSFWVAVLPAGREILGPVRFARRVFLGALRVAVLTVSPVVGLVRRACFHALRAALARLRARRTSRLASLMRLRARLSSSFASLTLCLATSTRKRARATAAPSSALTSGTFRSVAAGDCFICPTDVLAALRSLARAARQGKASGCLPGRTFAMVDLRRPDGYAFGAAVIHRSCV